MRQPYTILIIGATGVGKSEVALQVAGVLPAQIVNADMGQLYTPLSIGTAKPELPHATVAHHMYNVVDDPRSLDARTYRDMLEVVLHKIREQGSYAVVVGGSGLYGMSLVYPPQRIKEGDTAVAEGGGVYTWQRLQEIDPERAHEIHPHDQYRIQRALQLYEATGQRPSLYKPIYDPVGRLVVVWVKREKEELRARITQRAQQMLEQGWIEEVHGMMGTAWEQFLREKKIIGYDMIVGWLAEGKTERRELLEKIIKKTIAYAKQQETYWKMFVKKIREHPEHKVVECDLTEGEVGLYISHIKQIVEHE